MANWFTKLSPDFRKELMLLGKSYKEISKGCKLMDKTLKILQNSIPEKFKDAFEKQITEEIKNHKDFYTWNKIYTEIEECINHFDFCNDFAIDEIKKTEWSDYDFDGDLLGLFNSYLNEFYDICDRLIFGNLFDADCTKFCWVRF